MNLGSCVSMVALLALSACSHAPKSTQTEEIGALREQLKATVVKALSNLPGVKEVTAVEILGSEEKDGVARISYRAAYVSNSKETGSVANEIHADVHLIRNAERIWTATRIHPQAQSVVFQDATEIIVKPSTVNDL